MSIFYIAPEIELRICLCGGGQIEPVFVRKIGPDLVFGRLRQAMRLAEIVAGLAAKRKQGFDLERAVSLTVLHRLFASGSDRAAEVWKENSRIPGAEKLCLHQLYRTMGWLGEEIGQGLMGSPRCTKDLIEEALFDRGRDLFSEVGLVFFDTRPIYHKYDETIRGHVFCSFLALCLKREFGLRLEARGWKAEWAEIIRGLDNLQQVELLLQGSRFLLRGQISGDALQALRAAEVAVAPVLQEIT